MSNELNDIKALVDAMGKKDSEAKETKIAQVANPLDCATIKGNLDKVYAACKQVIETPRDEITYRSDVIRGLRDQLSQLDISIASIVFAIAERNHANNNAKKRCPRRRKTSKPSVPSKPKKLKLFGHSEAEVKDALAGLL